jgi:hypothetical protein
METLFPAIGLWRNAFKVPDGYADVLWKSRYEMERLEPWVDPREGIRRSYEISGPIRCRNFPETGLQDSEEDKYVFMLQDVMMECLLEYMKEYPTSFQDIQWQEAHRLLYYQPGARMGTHSDNTPGEHSRDGKTYKDLVAPVRVLCALQFLSDWVPDDDPEGDDFTGGEISWPYVGVTHEPQKGDLLIYPANFVYSHQVDPVLAGHRIVNLTCFCQGDIPDFSIRYGVLEHEMLICPGGNMYLDVQQDEIKWVKHGS